MTNSWIIYATVAAIVLAVLGFGMVVARFVAPELRLVDSWTLRRQIAHDAGRTLRRQPLFWTPGAIVVCAIMFAPVDRLARDWRTVVVSLIVVGASIVHSRFLYRKAIRRAMIAHMRCYGCGYNLTGNISGVCPECGTEIESPTSEEMGHPD